MHLNVRILAVAAALVGVVVLLAGSVQVCLCDPDPDRCGAACHVCGASRASASGGFEPTSGEPCLEASEDRCHHAVIEMGDLWANSSVGFVSAGGEAVGATRARIYQISHLRRLRPPSTAPPDSGGAYLAAATRLHPLS